MGVKKTRNSPIAFITHDQADSLVMVMRDPATQ
jgi:hypothetical protein